VEDEVTACHRNESTTHRVYLDGGAAAFQCPLFERRWYRNTQIFYLWEIRDIIGFVGVAGVKLAYRLWSM
jgi:hypothetical protein